MQTDNKSTDTEPIHFVCPDCGEHTKADEDLCCAHCGADCYIEDCRCVTPKVEVSHDAD